MISKSLNAILAKVALVIAVSIGQRAFGQTTVGIQPLGSYTDGGIDQISQSSLGVHIDIPLFQHKGRGSGLGTKVHLVYDSGYSSGGNPISDLGWRLVAGTATAGTIVIHQDYSEFHSRSCPVGVTRCNAGYTEYTYSFAFIDSTGFSHPFAGGSSIRCQGVSPDPCTNINLNAGGYADDNSGYYMAVNPITPSPLPSFVTVTTSSGDVSSTPQWGYTDANGNTGVSGLSEGGWWSEWSAQVTDDTNVSANILGGAYNSNNYAQWASRDPLQVQYLDTSGNSQTVAVNYSLHNVSQNCPSGPTWSQIIGLVDSVVYPDGSNYQFSYQQNGQLASMRLPTGGTITYNPSSLCVTASSGGYVGLPASLTRTTSDGQTVYSQTATPLVPYGTYPATSTTNISHPDGSSEQISFVYVFAPNNATGINNYGYETSHVWYSPAGAVLKSTMKCYNGATGDCTATPITLPITQIEGTTTLDNGLTAKNVQYMNTLGLTTEVDEYDFGASSPTRKTITAYAPLGNNIADRPSSVTVFNGSGTQVSQVTYGYDESGLTSTSSLPSHTAVSGSRGNRTSQHAWLNTMGGTLDSHWTYDDAGQIVAAQDPRQNWTNFGYDAATDSCHTNTTPPTPSSGVSQATSATCNASTGLPASATDANNVTTAYAYDSMLRLVGTSVSQGGTTVASTARSYSGSTLPETITTTVTATPSPNQVSTTILDGLGRTVTTVAPSGATTNTTYNSMGYVQSVSSPYFTTGDSTYGITSYLYDGLGRKTYQCQPDNSGSNTTTCSPSGSYQSWTYSGNATTFTDEVGNQWMQWTDGLGRLTKVKEPNGSSTAPSMETDYVYNALDNLLSVAQCSGSCPSTGTVGRSFTYDSLSRLVTATNPESGTVTYNYDANGNLSSKTSPAVNATSGTQTIGYCYDALNRMTYKFYSGSFSCTNSTGYAASYAYDTSTISGAGNVVGRLTDEQQYIGGTLVAERSPYQFTATGQLTREQQAPYSPNSTSYQFLYGYDLAGNQTCANNGFASVNSSSTCSNFTAIGSTIAEQFSYNGAGWLSNASVTLLPSLFTPSSAYPSTLLQASSSIPTNYDAMGHLVNAQLGVGSITAVQMVRQYDKRGRILSESDNNGSLYSYQVPAGTTGYRKNGNLGSFSDSVMGSWTFNYDTLNRLTTAQNTAVTSVSPQFAGIYGCWTYDAFGNRTSEAMSTTACSSNPTSASWAQYNGTGNGTNNNQMSATSQNLNQGNWYDAAGDVRFDGVNSYLYDTEGRVCAVSYTVAGTTIMTGYLYDASGTRVGKGSLQSWPSSCSALISGGGFVSTNQYLLGQGGEQVAELNGSGTILHSNVFTGGRLLATYNFTGSLGVHFALTDGLGTKRVQVSGTGASELSCLSLPFGNNIGNTPSTNCVGAGADATEQHFTGKERDTESGNDYFGARYYSSAMGRFMSPDWNESPVAIPYADLSNPQTLNLYVYLSNNPLNRTDPTGHAGKSGPIQLGGQTTMRVDTGGADQVNVHVFSKNGEYRGRLNPDTQKIEWTKGAPPKAIAEDAQAYCLSKGKFDIAIAKREMSILGGGKGLEEGRLGGSKLMEAGSWLLMALQIADIGVNAVRMREINKLEGTTGFHLDIGGNMQVTNLSKFGDTFGVGTGVSVNGDVFRLNDNGTWTDQFGQQLYQDSSGFHIGPASA